MGKRLLLALVIGAFSSAVFAQTAKENLDRGIALFDSCNAIVDEQMEATLTDEDFEAGRDRLDRGLEFLEKVIQNGSAEQKKAAEYYKAIFWYEHYFLLCFGAEYDEIEALQDEFEEDTPTYSPADFPIQYSYLDKNYVFKWEKYAYLLANHWIKVAEVKYDMGDYSKAIQYNQLVLKLPGVLPFLEFIATWYILDNDQKAGHSLPKTESHDYALQMMRAYDALSTEEKEAIKTNNFPNALKGANWILDDPEVTPAGLARAAKAAEIAYRYKDSEQKGVELYRFCYQKKYAGDATFHQKALAVAGEIFSKNPTDAREIGNPALAFLTPKSTPADCSILNDLAKAAAAIGNSLEKKALEKRFQTCQNEKEAEAARLVADQKKAEKKANRKFSMYAGIDLIPLLKKSVEEMDFGGHVDLRGRKVGHSFGFSQVNLRKDFNSGRARWDGNRYFYAIKFFTKSGNQIAYTGPFFGYAEKTFQPLTNVAVTAEDGTFQSMTLTPVDKQYEAMINYGAQILGRGLGMDFWMGIGGSYSQLSYKELAATDGFSFAGNDFFENRPPKEVFHLQIRMGISIGLAVGKKRT